MMSCRTVLSYYRVKSFLTINFNAQSKKNDAQNLINIAHFNSFMKSVMCIIPLNPNPETNARGIQQIVESKVLQPVSLAMLYHDGDGEVRIHLDDAFYEDGRVEIS